MIKELLDAMRENKQATDQLVVTIEKKCEGEHCEVSPFARTMQRQMNDQFQPRKLRQMA